MSQIRIQKALADAGVAGRRTVEEMIIEGHITVNGDPVTRLPCFVDPEHDRIEIDGETIRIRAARRMYFLVNKPKNVDCSFRGASDDGRRRIFDLVPRIAQRLLCVAPLGHADAGLVLLTNDGELAQQLTHPRYGVEKRYVVEIEGRVDGEAVERLKRGSFIGRHRIEGPKVKILERGAERTLLGMTATEGRNRELRRILARSGHRVVRLKRIALGPINDRGLKVGQFRTLHPGEVEALRRAAAQDGRRGPRQEMETVTETESRPPRPQRGHTSERRGRGSARRSKKDF